MNGRFLPACMAVLAFMVLVPGIADGAVLSLDLEPRILIREQIPQGAHVTFHGQINNWERPFDRKVILNVDLTKPDGSVERSTTIVGTEGAFSSAVHTGERPQLGTYTIRVYDGNSRAVSFEVQSAPAPERERWECEGCYHGRMLEAVDGNTLTVHTPEFSIIRIELALVNTPELREEGGSEARDFSRSICLPAKPIWYYPDPKQSDISKRKFVAEVWCQDRSLNAALVNSRHGTLDLSQCTESDFYNKDWAAECTDIVPDIDAQVSSNSLPDPNPIEPVVPNRGGPVAFLTNIFSDDGGYLFLLVIIVSITTVLVVSVKKISVSKSRTVHAVPIPERREDSVHGHGQNWQSPQYAGVLPKDTGIHGRHAPNADPMPAENKAPAGPRAGSQPDEGGGPPLDLYPGISSDEPIVPKADHLRSKEIRTSYKRDSSGSNYGTIALSVPKSVIFVDANVWIDYYTLHWPHINKNISIKDRIAAQTRISDYIIKLKHKKSLGLTFTVKREVIGSLTWSQHNINDKEIKKESKNFKNNFQKIIKEIEKSNIYIKTKSINITYRDKIGTLFHKIWDDSSKADKVDKWRYIKNKYNKDDDKYKEGPPDGNDITILATAWKYKDDHIDDIDHVAILTEDNDMGLFIDEIRAETGIEILRLQDLESKDKNWPSWVP